MFKILDDHYKMNFTPGSHSESIQPLNFHLPPDHQRLRIIHPPKDNSNCMPRRPPDGQALSSAGLGFTSTNTCWHAAQIIQRKFPQNPGLWILGNFCTTLYISLPPKRNPVMLMIAPASLWIEQFLRNLSGQSQWEDQIMRSSITCPSHHISACPPMASESGGGSWPWKCSTVEERQKRTAHTRSSTVCQGTKHTKRRRKKL